MSRSTKIVATIGPASSDFDVLVKMISAGVDVVRLNFSHGKSADHVERARLVREAAAACGREVAIMADMQGPKIRVGKFESGKIELAKDDKFILDAGWGEKGELGMEKDGMKKAMHKGAMATDGMKKEPNAKDEMKKDDMAKEAMKK